MTMACKSQDQHDSTACSSMAELQLLRSVAPWLNCGRAMVSRGAPSCHIRADGHGRQSRSAEQRASRAAARRASRPNAWPPAPGRARLPGPGGGLGPRRSVSTGAGSRRGQR